MSRPKRSGATASTYATVARPLGSNEIAWRSDRTSITGTRSGYASAANNAVRGEPPLAWMSAYEKRGIHHLTSGSCAASLVCAW